MVTVMDKNLERNQMGEEKRKVGNFSVMAIAFFGYLEGRCAVPRWLLLWTLAVTRSTQFCRGSSQRSSYDSSKGVHVSKTLQSAVPTYHHPLD